MTVRYADNKDFAAVEEYVRKTDGASLYHRLGWGEIIEECFSHRSHYLLYEGEGGRILGVLPLVHMRSVTFGNLMVSMPYFNYGGVCADDRESESALIYEAVRLASRSGAGHIEFRQEQPLDNGFPVKTSKVSMRLLLPASADELWKSFPSKLRNQIRRPQKAGMTVRVGREEELDGFYRVFSVCMRDLGTPVYPKRFFRAILDRFPDCTWIVTIYGQGGPMASGFLASFKDRVEIPWGASLHKFNALSPNMLLYWSCLEFACSQGFRVFDFGRSTVGEGTYRFKEQWGAEPSPMNWHYWMADAGTLPEINPRNPKYRLAIAMWKKLPVPLTKLLGPSIVRNIP